MTLHHVREWCPTGIPEHPDFGTRYPWRALRLHSLTRDFRARLDGARRALDRARILDLDWRVGLSGGKDSTALAILLSEHGWRVRGMSVKDDLDYPGERDYIAALLARAVLDADILTPQVSLLAWLRQHRVSLVDDLHSRAAELSREHFYGLLDRHRAQHGYAGVLLGLRSQESRGRRMNRATHGLVYTRRFDGLTIAQPLADWTPEDVHAFLLSRDVPLLPVYLCIDPEQDPMSLRKSWWVCGGGVARRGGHYTWLRRWWPQLYQLAADIDPEVRRIS